MDEVLVVVVLHDGVEVHVVVGDPGKGSLLPGVEGSETDIVGCHQLCHQAPSKYAVVCVKFKGNPKIFSCYIFVITKEKENREKRVPPSHRIFVEG